MTRMYRSPTGMGIAAALLILLLVLIIDRQDAALHRQEARELMHQSLDAITTRLRAEVDKHLYLTNALAAYTATTPQLDQQAFARLARELLRDKPHVRYVTLARDNRISHTYPPEAAAAVYGLDLLAQPTQRDALLQAIQSGEEAIGGPLAPSPGGSGLMLHAPVYRNGPGGEAHFWGMASLLLDMEAVFKEVGALAQAKRFDFAIRRNGPSRPSLLIGSPALFESRAALSTHLALPASDWEMAVQPQADAMPHRPMGMVLRLSGLLVALLAGLLVYTVLRHQRNIHHIALHDCLTDLPNRLLLEDRLTQAVAGAQRSCKHTVLLYLDLDDFKPINDRFGHNTGNETLRQIARRLEACVRKTDTVSRISGDEFAIVLNRLGHLRDAEAIAEKILAAINQPLQLGGEQVQLGVSIGLYAIPNLEYDAEEALQRADAAMYEAKHKSKNSYRWYTQYPKQLELGVLAEQAHSA